MNYVTSIDYLFFTLAGIALFIFRARDRGADRERSAGVRVPGHPYTTALFTLIAAAVVADTYIKYPQNSLIGLGLLLLAVPVYYFVLGKQPLTAQSTQD